MATGETTRPAIDNPEAMKTEWLDRLDTLVGQVEHLGPGLRLAHPPR